MIIFDEFFVFLVKFPAFSSSLQSGNAPCSWFADKSTKTKFSK
uniref:Uncharacterized protein n=1 Tax=Arundo donax TaxID=35708 RepID=A0A0A8Y1A5_ARUDO